MPTPTPTYQLIEERLGRDLAAYLRVRLAEGIGWRRIAQDVHRDTGVDVSHETLRRWHAESTEPAA